MKRHPKRACVGIAGVQLGRGRYRVRAEFNRDSLYIRRYRHMQASNGSIQIRRELPDIERLPVGKHIDPLCSSRSDQGRVHIEFKIDVVRRWDRGEEPENMAFPHAPHAPLLWLSPTFPEEQARGSTIRSIDPTSPQGRAPLSSVPALR
jgi:hypothetical protein